MVYRIGIIGYGGVSQAMVQILCKKLNQLERQYAVIAVSDNWKGAAFDKNGLDLDILANLPVAENALSTLANGSVQPCNEQIINDPSIDIVIEATFTDPNTGEPALSHCKRALEQGKHVITTNKGPVAFAAKELEELARKNNCRFLYEGSVMSGTPVINLIENCLHGAEVKAISGIMNGTSNYILTKMGEGLSFEDALSQAQELGYAENDPTADVGGSDVALKVMILSNQIMNAEIKYQDVYQQGITSITQQDIEAARAENCCWKLLGTCDQQGVAKVEPVKLDNSHPLAAINGATNAVLITTDHLGDICISGPGAGREETGYALITDLLSLPESTDSRS